MFGLSVGKEIEYQDLIIKDLLLKTKCCNEPDASVLKQPFSLAFLNERIESKIGVS